MRIWPRKIKLVGAGTICLFAAGLLLDELSSKFRDWWTSRALTTNLVTSALVVAFGVAVINELGRRRDQRRTDDVARRAKIELASRAASAAERLADEAFLASLATGSSSETPEAHALLNELRLRAGEAGRDLAVDAQRWEHLLADREDMQALYKEHAKLREHIDVVREMATTKTRPGIFDAPREPSDWKEYSEFLDYDAKDMSKRATEAEWGHEGPPWGHGATAG